MEIKLATMFVLCGFCSIVSQASAEVEAPDKHNTSATTKTVSITSEFSNDLSKARSTPSKA